MYISYMYMKFEGARVFPTTVDDSVALHCVLEYTLLHATGARSTTYTDFYFEERSPTDL